MLREYNVLRTHFRGMLNQLRIKLCVFNKNQSPILLPLVTSFVEKSTKEKLFSFYRWFFFCVCLFPFSKKVLCFSDYCCSFFFYYFELLGNVLELNSKHFCKVTLDYKSGCKEMK